MIHVELPMRAALELDLEAAAPPDNPLPFSPRSCGSHGVVELPGGGYAAGADLNGSVSASAATNSELPPCTANATRPGAAGEQPDSGLDDRPGSDCTASRLTIHIDAMLAERTRAAERFGHTLERDLRRRPAVLPDRAIRALVHVQEDFHFKPGDNWRDLARKHAIEAGALVLALLDYIDNGGGER